jgi:hypothetical protein
VLHCSTQCILLDTMRGPLCMWGAETCLLQPLGIGYSRSRIQGSPDPCSGAASVVRSEVIVVRQQLCRARHARRNSVGFNDFGPPITCRKKERNSKTEKQESYLICRSAIPQPRADAGGHRLTFTTYLVKYSRWPLTFSDDVRCMAF